VDEAAVRDIFEQPDQERVRDDLAAFFGPHAGAYLRVYDTMRKGAKQWVASWSWPAFFAPAAWLFYRKLHLYGALCLVIPVVIGLVFDITAAGAAAVAIALSAKAWYVSAGLRRIAEADQLELRDEERRDFLRRVGGVSPSAGWLVGILHIALAMLVVAQTFADVGTILSGDDSLGQMDTILASPSR
jgi:hypothetical protein